MPFSSPGPPVISIVGASGVGKTTLLEKLIPEFNRLGLKVGTIKHHTHEFEMDREGKDSWRHKRAGASVSMISAPGKIGVVMDADHDHRVEELLPFFSMVDLVITEGYKRETYPKIEVLRPELTRELLCGGDGRLLAVVSDAPVAIDVARFSVDDVKGLAGFIVSRFHLIHPVSAGARAAPP